MTGEFAALQKKYLEKIEEYAAKRSISIEQARAELSAAGINL